MTRQAILRWCFLFAFITGGFFSHAFSLSMVGRGAVVVAGATGYIGKSTVRESVRQGYKTVALVRNLDKVQSESGQRLYRDFFEDAEVIECDVSDPAQLEKVREEPRSNPLMKITFILRFSIFLIKHAIDNEANSI